MLNWIRSLCQSFYDFLLSLFMQKVINFPRTDITVAVNIKAQPNTDSLDAAAASIGSRSHHIGEGAFSVVYKAKDRNSTGSNSKFYALKRMLLQSPECAQIAKIEIDSFQKFRHSHIIPLVDYTESVEQGRRVAYLLLPFCANGSLRHRLNLLVHSNPSSSSSIENGFSRLTNLRQVLSDFRDICDALNVLHSCQPSYVHQDIKPDNILLDDQWRPLLTDFGSVRRADVAINTRNDSLRIADEAAQFCTASYRSPELYDPVKGMILDYRTDVWSMGCLLFAWWVGYSPFECEFTLQDRVRCVECTTLRILSTPPRKNNPTRDDLIIYELCDWILSQSLTQRPFTPDIIARLNQVIDSIDGVKKPQAAKSAKVPFNPSMAFV